MTFRWLVVAALTLLSGFTALTHAAVQTKVVEYEHEGVKLKGFLAWDDAAQGKQPGVLVVHEWWGLNDYTRKRATMLAELGYVAFALDMYGEGRSTTHPKEAGEWMTAAKANVEQWRARAASGLKVLAQQPEVDASKLAAAGYCFGGATVLQLAYAGSDLKLVASFHGSLPPADATAKLPIKPRIMVYHGAADPLIPAEQIQKFQVSLDNAKADWTMISYGGVKHSFTNPEADKNGIEALKYDPKADERSWASFKDTLQAVFK